MEYFIMPIVYVFSFCIFPLFLYWNPSLYVNCLFDRIEEATFQKVIDKVI